MEDKDTIDIGELFFAVVKKWYIVAISALIAAVAVVVYTVNFVTPMYQSDGSLYVSSSTEISFNEDISQQVITASQELAATYAEILQRRTFLSYISENLQSQYSGEEIGSMLTITPIAETEILELTIVTPDAEESYRILNEILFHAKDELLRVIKSGSIEILDQASMPTAPVSPNIYKNTAIGLLAGIVIGVAIIFIMNTFDTRIKTVDEMRVLNEEPVLGEIPVFASAEKHSSDKKHGGGE